MDATRATVIVKEYFKQVKTHDKFLFDPIEVEMNEDEDTWVVTCKVQDAFSDPIFYEVEVDDETEEILTVKAIEEE
ncbi:MAG: hypothetical protein KAU14_09340 [Thermoplasmata archaeon]|nr:hypothetical protein [Thermoplasmata archaeon]